MTLHHLRQDYTKGTLAESQVDADPVQQFARWFAEAQQAGIREPNAMTLATCNSSGFPSARIVLLKDFNAQGFTFFTNQQSQKASDLAVHPYAALLFHWDALERQVRIGGGVAMVGRDEAQAYHHARPRASQLAAWASEQSSVIASRAELDSEYARLEKEYEGREIPCPPHWGGYRLTPVRFEFWQGRSSRLHDRLVYRLTSTQNWVLERLAP